MLFEIRDADLRGNVQHMTVVSQSQGSILWVIYTRTYSSIYVRNHTVVCCIILAHTPEHVGISNAH